MFCFDSIVKYSEIDEDRHMTLTAILDLLQDCCIFQSEELGVGLSFLKEKQRAWVLSSWQVKIRRYPKLGEQLRACTWPYDFKNFMGYRNFKIEDETGEEIACANSVWVFIDITNGRPVRVPEEIKAKYSFEEPYDMECLGRKIRTEEGMEPKEPVRIGRFHIDTNRHVNNGKYVMIAEEYLPESFKVKELRAEYKKAAVLSDFLYPRVKVMDRSAMVVLADADEKPYAVLELREDAI